MSRILSTLVVLALFGALFLLPGADPAELGALQIGDLLEETAPVQESSSTDEYPHSELILLSSATASGSKPGQLQLRLGQVVLSGADGAPVSDAASAAARRSLIASLRESFPGLAAEFTELRDQEDLDQEQALRLRPL
ncbi:MAG: hypothetical protein ACI9C2_002235, partial [Gammaproteobacteria bacterium]